MTIHKKGAIEYFHAEIIYDYKDRFVDSPLDSYV